MNYFFQVHKKAGIEYTKSTCLADWLQFLEINKTY